MDLFSRAAAEGDIVLDTQDKPVHTEWASLDGRPVNGQPKYIVPEDVSKAAYPSGHYGPEAYMAKAIGNPSNAWEVRQLRTAEWHLAGCHRRAAWRMVKLSMWAVWRCVTLTCRLWFKRV